MRSPLRLVKTSITVTLFGVLSLTACDNQSNSDVDAGTSEQDVDVVANDPSETTGNPCLSPWVIQGMKENINERALELLVNQHGFDDSYQPLLDSSDITFSFISEPSETTEGIVMCSAQADVTYTGDASTSETIVSDAARRIRTGSYATSFMGLGITSYNINEFRKMLGNSFQSDVSYEIGSSYSEDGEKRESYNAYLDAPATMLASVVAFDKYIQENIAAEARLKKKWTEQSEQLAEHQATLEAERQDRDIEDAMAADAYYESDTESYDDEEVVVEDVTEDEVAY